MKTLITVIFALVSFTLASFAGPRSDGGGNLIVRINSVEKVNTALDQAKDAAIGQFGLLVMDHGLDQPWKGAELNKIMQAMIKGSNPMPMGSFIHGSAFQAAVRESKLIRKNGLCTSRKGHPRDSSVAEDKPGSPICISITSLQRVDDEFLEAQISALIAHEVAHQFGANEETAVKVQMAVLHSSQKNFVFDYVGLNVRILSEEKKDPMVSNAFIKIRGSDAKALYDALEAKPTSHEGNEYTPAFLLKKGESYFCIKFLPIKASSKFAQNLEYWNRKVIQTYDYECRLNVRTESGKIIP